METAPIRYRDVNTAWPENLPILNMEDALRYASRLRIKFMKIEKGPGKYKGFTKYRRSWASTGKTAESFRSGWRNLVHDVSHDVFFYSHPGLKGHSHRHADLEFRMIRYVVEKTDWLTPKVETVPTRDEKAGKVRANLEARLKTWKSKFSRAETAIGNLERQLKALDKGVIPRGRRKAKPVLNYAEKAKKEDRAAKREAKTLLIQFPKIEWDWIEDRKEAPRMVYPPSGLFTDDRDDPYQGNHVCDDWRDVARMMRKYVEVIKANA